MRQRYIVSALIVLITLALMLPSTAISRDKDTSQPWNWKESGALGNGSAMSLAYDAGRDILYRGTHRGVYKYQNGTFTSLGGEVEGYNISCLAYDSTRNVIYAGVDPVEYAGGLGGVWRCDNPDSSPSWVQISGQSDVGDYRIFSMAFGKDRNLLYTGVGGYNPGRHLGVWKCSTPNTSPSWSAVGSELRDYEVYSLTYDRNNNILYGGVFYDTQETTEAKGVWRCTNADTSPSWAKISDSSNVGDDWVVCVDYDANHNILYAATWNHGVWRCDNPNTSPGWTDTGGGLIYDNASLVYDGTHNILYLGTHQHGVFRCKTPDTVPNWTSTGGEMSGDTIHSLVYVSTQNVLYAGTGNGLWYSNNPDTSPSWINMGPGVSDSIVDNIVYDCNRNILYASIIEGDVYRCDDPDAESPTWVNMGVDLGSNLFRSFIYDSTHNVLYAGAGGSLMGVWRCDNPDTSPTWTKIEMDDQIPSVPSLACDETNNILYAGTMEWGVWRCDNPTESPSWSNTGMEISDHTYVNCLTYDSNRSELYAGIMGKQVTSDYNGSGVWRCDNPGEDPDWTKISTPDDVGYQQIHSLVSDVIHNKLYAGAYNGLWRCDNPDSNPSWTKFEEGEYLNGYLDCLVYDSDGNLVYVGADNGVWVFTNPDTDPVWENTGEDEMPYTVNALMVTPPEEGEGGAGGNGVSSVIYAGTGGQGVWYAQSQASSLDTWYLAEGSTGTNEQGSFETWVLVQNPGSQAATVTLTYMTPSGEVTGPTQQIGAGSRTTFNVADTPEVANEFNVSTKVTSDQPVIAERAMYWNAADGTYRRCAHDSIGVTGAATTWYLAEGSTGTNELGSFETWVLVQNPGDETATVALTYMTPAGEIAVPTMEVAAGSRQSFNVADTPEVAGEFNVSTRVTSDKPVIAERAMYWNPAGGPFRQAAHDSIGVTGTASTWYLAEGSTGTNERGTFETWVLVQNPGEETANVSLTYMTPAGEIAGPSMEIAAGSRQSFNVADTPEVAGEFNVSTRVTSDQPVIAERAMYWNPASGPYRQAAHDSIGVTGAANTWDLAEGSTGTNEQGTFETWVLVQNPGSETATVALTYMTPSGEVAGPSMEIAAGSRQSFNVADTPEVANVFSVSTRVTSDRPVIAERAMYWNPVAGPYRQAAHDSIGVGI